MLFNSAEFIIFLPIVFLLFWLVLNRSLHGRNILLLISSYVFYGWWDWRFLFLIAISSFIDYSIGLNISNTKNKLNKKILLGISLMSNLGILGFFKYYNFFVDSFSEMFLRFGVELNPYTLNIILPVGISFYTFQTLSYTIDIYRGELKPTKDIIAFFAFVSFFPQLVAGPIERAKNLLPQFLVNRKFDYDLAKDGLRQIMVGIFKKVVIADICAEHVNYIFDSYQELPGSTLVIGALYFSFQIYGDFSGYSDIAIGTAKLFNFKLMRNFAFPYFSRNIGEFWRRWHISLSTWFRDYVYIPLGGSYGHKYIHIRNIIITFTVSGLWHGANWTFIVWGFLNGLYYIPLMLKNKQNEYKGGLAENSFFPSLKEVFNICLTFMLTTLTWVFFRSENITHAFSYLDGIFDSSLFSNPSNKSDLYLIAILVIVEYIQRHKEHFLDIGNLPQYIRWLIYFIVFFVIIILGEFTKNEFIYFQF